MGDWHVWIIPIIAIAVWIIGALVRGRENEQNRQPGGPLNPGGRPRTREPVTDLDRFLREVHRRRQAAEQKEALERSPSPPVIVEPVPSPPPFVLQPAEEGRPQTGRPVRRPRGPEAAENIPTVLPVAPPTTVLTLSPLPELAVLPAFTPPVSPEVIPTALPSAKAPSPIKREVWGLLKSADGLRAAVILQEVLGPPRSRRLGPETYRGPVD
jgi:hypothetical protein